MKKVLIASLVLANLVLVGLLVFGIDQQPAHAQGRGQADYLVMTSRVAENLDIIYVVDTSKQQMVAFELDRQKKLSKYPVRNFKDDFRQEK